MSFSLPLQAAYAFGFPIHYHIHPTFFIHLFAGYLILLLIYFLIKREDTIDKFIFLISNILLSYLISITDHTVFQYSYALNFNFNLIPGRYFVNTWRRARSYNITGLKSHDAGNELY